MTTLYGHLVGTDAVWLFGWSHWCKCTKLKALGGIIISRFYYVGGICLCAKSLRSFESAQLCLKTICQSSRWKRGKPRYFDAIIEQKIVVSDDVTWSSLNPVGQHFLVISWGPPMTRPSQWRRNNSKVTRGTWSVEIACFGGVYMRMHQIRRWNW